MGLQGLLKPAVKEIGIMESLFGESTLEVWKWVTIFAFAVSFVIWLSGLRKGWIPSKGHVSGWDVPWMRFLLLLWLVLTLSVILPVTIFGLSGGMNGDESSDAVRLWKSFSLTIGMQVVMIAGLVGAGVFAGEWFPAVLSGMQGKERPARWIRTTILRFLQFLPLVWLASMLVELAYNWLGIPVELQESVTMMMRIDDPLLWVVAVFSTVVLAPLAEELVFRGVVYRFLKSRFRPELAVIVSAALFSVIHIEVSVLLPLFVLGIVLALVYEETGDIRAPILFHGIFNLQTMGLILLDRFVLNAGSSLLP